MSASPEHALEVLREADCLVPEATVTAAYEHLATAIAADYEKLDPLILCVMNGGLNATAQITERLRFPLQLDYLHASRYRGATSGGGLVWKVQPRPERISGRHVLVIDDILDEGNTLVAIREAISEFKPASLRVAVLVKKLHERRVPDAFAEYVGLEVEDRYIFGCGMDYKEYWRQLPAIYAVKGL